VGCIVCINVFVIVNSLPCPCAVVCTAHPQDPYQATMVLAGEVIGTGETLADTSEGVLQGVFPLVAALHPPPPAPARKHMIMRLMHFNDNTPCVYSAECGHACSPFPGFLCSKPQKPARQLCRSTDEGPLYATWILAAFC